MTQAHRISIYRTPQSRLTRLLMPLLGAALIVTGCATPREIGKSAHEFELNPPGRSEAEIADDLDGIHLRQDRSIAVKVNDRSLLSMVDELAYKVGFSYTVLSDLSRFKLTRHSPCEASGTDSILKAAPGSISGAGNAASARVCQKIYRASVDANPPEGHPKGPVATSPSRCPSHADASGKLPPDGNKPEKIALGDWVDTVNAQLTAETRPYCLRAEWRSSGVQLALKEAIGDNGILLHCTEDRGVDDPYCSTKMTFQKAFFRNVTSDDAAHAISALLGDEVALKSGNQQQPPAGNIQSGNQFQQMGIGQDRAPLDSTRAILIQYKAQNAIMVRGANDRTYDRIAQLLPAIDAEFQQVLVETQVYEYDDSVARKIGAALEYSKQNLNTGSGRSNELGLTTMFGENITSALPIFFHRLTDSQKKATLLSRLALYDRDGLVRVLAEPRLMLKSGEHAEVKLQSKRYFLTNTNFGAGDLHGLATGITLKVTPTVLGNNRIHLRLAIAQSEFIPSGDTSVAAATNENTIDTSIVVDDQELISIGGIMSKKDSRFSSGIPGLRKIPVLGALFGAEQQDTSVVRVDFMIRPTVANARVASAALLNQLRSANAEINKEMNKTPRSTARDARVVTIDELPLDPNAPQ